jgi:hypothetical protein
MRLRLRHAVGLVAAATVITLTAQAAVAAPEGDKPGGSDDPKAGSNISYERFVKQGPLVQAADAITALDPARKQLAGIRLQVDDGAIEVFYKGNPSPDVASEIKQLRDQGIDVRLYGAEFSGAEMSAAADQMWSQRDKYPGLIYLAADVDGSGVRMAVTDHTAVKGVDFPIPTDVVDDGQFHFASRVDDGAPLWAGAEASFKRGGLCTTGFPVYRSNVFGITDTGLLLAEHCAAGLGPTTSQEVDNGRGMKLGDTEVPSAGTENQKTDSLFMHTQSGAHIYDGGTTGHGEFSKPVTSDSGNYLNAWVCSSGAMTGVACDIKTDIITLKMDVGGVEVDGVVLGHGMDGPTQSVVGHGDSGAPVFTLDPANINNVWAVGMADVLQQSVPCPPFSVPTTCGHVLGWVDIRDIEAAQQFHIKTFEHP